MAFQPYKSQVPLQGGPTQAPASYQTPVADAIGQSAGYVSQFVQKYQEAQYNRSKIETMLQVKKNINEYQENLRTNPIVKQTPDDDIVSLKESDWQKFSNDQVRKNVLGQIKDPKLKEEMNLWWDNETENYRSNIVNAAMDENIVYMGERTKEDINTAIYEGQYAFALSMASDAVKDGLITREEEDGYKDYTALQSIISATQGMSIEEAETVVNESPLEAKEKIKAKEYISDRYKVRKSEIDTATTIYMNTNAMKFYSAIQNGEIVTKEQLDNAFRNLKDATYNGEDIQGTAVDFVAKNQVKLYDLLDRLRKEREAKNKGEELPESDPAKADLDKILLSGTRDNLLDALYTYQSQGDINSDTVEEYIGKANKSIYQRLNDNHINSFEDSLNSLIKDKVITQDQEGMIRSRWNDHIETYSDEQVFKEKYYDDMKQFFDNTRKDKVSYDIDQMNLRLREDGNFVTRNDLEKTLLHGLSGDYIGLVNSSKVEEYVSTGNAKSLREDTTNYLYGNKNYDELNNDQQNRVDLSVAIGNYSSAVQSLANQEIKPGAKIQIDPNGMPTVIYGDGTEAYRLQLDETGMEEEWYTYGTLNGKDGWYPTGIEIPEIKKTPSFISTGYEELNKALEKLDTAEARSIQENIRNEALKKYPGLPGLSGVK